MISSYHQHAFRQMACSAGCASWVGMATPGLVSSPPTAVAMLVVGSLGTAMSDVVIDSIVVQKSRSADSQVRCAIYITAATTSSR